MGRSESTVKVLGGSDGYGALTDIRVVKDDLLTCVVNKIIDQPCQRHWPRRYSGLPAVAHQSVGQPLARIATPRL